MCLFMLFSPSFFCCAFPLLSFFVLLTLSIFVFPFLSCSVSGLFPSSATLKKKKCHGQITHESPTLCPRDSCQFSISHQDQVGPHNLEGNLPEIGLLSSQFLTPNGLRNGGSGDNHLNELSFTRGHNIIKPTDLKVSTIFSITWAHTVF